jgi:hypothetical protein
MWMDTVPLYLTSVITQQHIKVVTTMFRVGADKPLSFTKEMLL